MTGWDVDLAHDAALTEEAWRNGEGTGADRRAIRIQKIRSAQEKAEIAFIERLDKANAERIQALIDNGVDPAIICKACGMVHSRGNRGGGLEELMKQIRRR